MKSAEPVTHTDDMAAQVRRALCHSGYLDLRCVEVTHLQDGIRLRGTVRTYYLKQMAQSLTLSTDGVRQVHNEMEVR